MLIIFVSQWNKNWASIDFLKIIHRNNFSVYVTLPQDTGASSQYSDSFQNTLTKHWLISPRPRQGTDKPDACGGR